MRKFTERLKKLRMSCSSMIFVRESNCGYRESYLKSRIDQNYIRIKRVKLYLHFIRVIMRKWRDS